MTVFDNPAIEARTAAIAVVVEAYKLDKKLTEKYVAHLKPQIKEVHFANMRNSYNQVTRIQICRGSSLYACFEEGRSK
jgi:hypothetical protein